MNREEQARVIKVVTHGWPNAKLTEETVFLYMTALADLPYEATNLVLTDLLMTSDFRPSVAKIRRAVAGKLGLLPPSADSALAAAAIWVEYREQLQFVNGSGYSPTPPAAVHPLVRKVVETLDTTHGSWRAQFTKAYAAAATSQVKNATGTRMMQLAEESQRALGGGA